MARGDVRIAVTLACEECKRRNYQTNKSKRNNPDRISLRSTAAGAGGTRATARPVREYSPVARDRQRAKQRRAKRQPGAGGPAAGSASTNPRDIGLDQADADDAGLGNTDAARAHQARDAPRRGGRTWPRRRRSRTTRARVDEVEGDLVPTARPGAAERAAHRGPRRRRGRLLSFLGHCIDELKRVQWPDRRQVGQGTAVTLGFTVLAGSYLGLLDAIWKPLIEAIL